MGWISPINLGLATQFAKDACASGYADYATGLLFPYVSALSGQPLEPAMDLALREARELLRLAMQNADYFGKPPGWVPTLALESAAGIYDTLLPQAMNELYAAYYIERIAQSKQDKQQALRNFRALINNSSATAKEELVALRKQLPRAMDDLEQLVIEMAEVSDKLAERERALRERADQETVSQEQREAVAAGLKIAGAVIKAIPLPEPFQTAAGAFGSILDISGELVDTGGSDAAFEHLKTQVTAFTGDKESLTDYLNADLDVSLEVGALEKDAAAARRDKEALEAKWGEQAKELEALKEKRKEVYDTKKEALLYSRASTLPERAKIAKRAEKLTTTYQQDVATLEAAANQKTLAYQAAQTKLSGLEADIAAKKADFERDKEARDKKKAANAKAVQTRMKQLQTVATSVAGIAATLNKLAVSRTQLNSKFDQALAKLEKDEILLCVGNDCGLEVPVSVDVKDMSGRSGGIGRYVGVFNVRALAAAGRSAVRVSVPAEYGQYRLAGWEVDGEVRRADGPSLEVAKDAYLVANYAGRSGAVSAGAGGRAWA